MKKNLLKISKGIGLVLLKLSLSFLAFYAISKRVTFNPIQYLNKSNLNYFIAAFAVVFAMIVLQAWRWKNILGVFSARLSLKKCLIAVWFGHLLNNILPTSTAGDLLRSYSLRGINANQSKWRWVGAFFSEKYSAASSALLLASIALLSSISSQLPIILSGFIVLLFLLLVMIPLLGAKFLSIIRLPHLEKITHHFRQLMHALTQTFTDSHGRYAFVASLLINLAMCIIFYAIAAGVGISLKFTVCLFVVPVFTLLATLPISFAGWGVRELSCIGLLGFFGVSSESAVIISVMYGLVNLFSSLPGILVAYPFLSSLRKNTLRIE